MDPGREDACQPAGEGGTVTVPLWLVVVIAAVAMYAGIALGLAIGRWDNNPTEE